MIKIGLIDSGIGGLSILKAIIDSGIEADFRYILDDKYMPYGNRTKTELTAIAFRNCEKLIAKGVDIIIFACNTLTSSCIKEMRRIFNLPIIGTEPPIKPCALECQRVALLATPFTLRSENINTLIHTYDNVEYYFPNCRDFAECIERNICNDKAITDCIREELTRYKFCDGVVIGCTHYNFITHNIATIMDKSKIYSSSSGVCERLANLIDTEKSAVCERNESKISVYTTKTDIDMDRKFVLCKYIGITIEFSRLM